DRHGIRSLFIVDDDFFRSPTWEPILEGMAAYRRDGHDLSFMMQVDAEAAAFGDLRPGEPPSSQRRKCERFLELAAAAGCYSAFVGFETFNPQNLLAATKVQNLDKEQRRRKDDTAGQALLAVKEKYRRVVRNWHAHGVAVHCGYMIGFPFDGPECGRQSAEWLLDVGVDRLVLHRDAAAWHRGSRQGGARGNDRRLGLQQLRLAAHGVASPAHDDGTGGFGLPGRGA